MIILLRTLAVALFGAMVVGAPLAAMHLLRAGWSDWAITVILLPINLVVVGVVRGLLQVARARRRDVDPVL